jgi:uncharacterized protein YbjT (DUF2867 family)
MGESTMPVLVTGPTGNTGTAVIDELARRGVSYRAMVRSAEDADRLARPPESVAVADFDDEGDVAAALTGIARAYLVTPSSEQAEAQQIRFAELAAAAGVEHLVVLSQLGAAIDSPVRFLRYHAAVEQRVLDLGLPYTFLRPNLYFQGLFAFAAGIASGSPFGAPIGDAQVSAIDVRDIGAVAAAALSESSHTGRTYTLTGPRPVTHPEIAQALGAALGREVTFVDIPPEAFAQSLAGLLPDWQIGGLVEDYAHYRRGEAAAATTTVEDITGRPAIAIEQFASDYADRFR